MVERQEQAADRNRRRRLLSHFQLVIEGDNRCYKDRARGAVVSSMSWASAFFAHKVESKLSVIVGGSETHLCCVFAADRAPERKGKRDVEQVLERAQLLAGSLSRTRVRAVPSRYRHFKKVRLRWPHTHASRLRRALAARYRQVATYSRDCRWRDR